MAYSDSGVSLFTYKGKGKMENKALLNLKEFCEYLGIGETKARELMTKTNNPFTVRIGNRLYANKLLLDKWVNSISGNRIA